MRRLFSSLLLLFLCLRLGAVEMPAYLRIALARFSPDVPRGWAYSITTTRGSEQALEHFDPSAPASHQWTLVQRNGRAPTAEDIHQYLSYKTTNAEAVRATFGRGDLDYGTLRLEHEDSTHAVFSCRFRTDANDPLLDHLQVTLRVSKQPETIEAFRLALVAPYSPVLTMKTLELDVQTTFSPPRADRPGLPQHTSSHFRGRVLVVKSVEENLQSDYSDFTHVGVKPAPSGVDAPEN